MLRKRFIIETRNDILKNVAHLIRFKHRIFNCFLINILSAPAVYCRFDKKPAINIDFGIGGKECSSVCCNKYILHKWFYFIILHLMQFLFLRPYFLKHESLF